jgi:septal ring factor EnvC (AmiA/AmiB activator)
MRQIIVVFAGLLLFASCSDLKKGQHLDSIKAMNHSLDSLEKVLQANQIDTLPGLITATMTLELRIKNNYNADTLDMELGKKMDHFKRTRKSLKPLGTSYSSVRVGIKEEREILEKLKKDITEGNGNRKKYSEYIEFEQNKVDQLRKLLAAYITEKEKVLNELGRIYPELNAYSMELLRKNQHKKK